MRIAKQIRSIYNWCNICRKKIKTLTPKKVICPKTTYYGSRDRIQLQHEIKRTIKEGASDAHVPALLKQVKKIPYTRSGKKVELAVKDLISGVEPKNVGALVDASAFDEYRELAKTWKS